MSRCDFMGLFIKNNGKEIIETNYFDSNLNAGGKFFVSLNAGAVRLLVPDVLLQEIRRELMIAEKFEMSRKPFPELGLNDALEILFEDFSDAPYVLKLSPNSFDRLPAQGDYGRTFDFSAWTDGPKKIFESNIKIKK